MLRLIHMNGRADKVRAATRECANVFIRRARHKSGRAIPIVKNVVLSANGQDVGMSGHSPEWIEILNLHAANRIRFAQPAKGRQQLLLACIRLRRGNQIADLSGDPPRLSGRNVAHAR